MEKSKELPSKNKEDASKASENIIDDELDAILDHIPKEERHEVKRMIGMSMQMGGVISPQLELMKKMTPEHVTDFLQGQREATQYQFKESRDSKLFRCVILLMVLIFVLILIILLKDQPETMEKVLYAAGGFAAGILGGYGAGRIKGN